jgi:hypothetical protein
MRATENPGGDISARPPKPNGEPETPPRGEETSDGSPDSGQARGPVGVLTPNLRGAFPPGSEPWEESRNLLA